MRLVGYSDRLSAAPGEAISFMVSCQEGEYDAQLVRLIHGDPNPNGPGFKEAEVASAIDGSYPGREQAIRTGSFVRIDHAAPLNLDDCFTIAAWIMPTLPGCSAQAIVAKFDEATQAGYALELTDAGALALRLGDGARVSTFETGAAMRADTWYFVLASIDGGANRVILMQRALDVWPLDDSNVVKNFETDDDRAASNTVPLLIGASSLDEENGPAGCFNGKIDNPAILSRALTTGEAAALFARHVPEMPADALVARWDFSRGMSSSTVADLGPHALHGEAINAPTRAVTGHCWTGDQHNPAHAPAEYAAIHFHDDDLNDAGWDVDFTLTIPDDLPSAVYAIRLTTEGAEDYLPFVVRPRKGRPASKIAYLISTFTYLAYANEHTPIEPVALYPFLDPDAHAAEYAYIAANKLNSLYDVHTDGSGVCYASWKRPLVNTRPKAYFRIFSSPERLGTDLYLTDWLEEKGIAVDTIADENIHDEGIALLRQYPALVTGSHPEYWTTPMMDALTSYLEAGGRVMYLGGNGFYWVTAVDPERPHLIEIRRAGGTATWSAAPGETYLSTTGGRGGLWRHRNRAPNKLLGVGFTAQGNDYSRPYDRQPDSYDPRAAFIFEGVDDGPIGDFPSLMLRHGAAGYEIDRADFSLGTPPHALVLASASGFSDSYQHAIEEVLSTDAAQGGSVHPLVKADIVYFEGPHDGGVFSVGSIAWLGALSYNGYDNNVSRITENVLRRFAAAPSAVGKSGDQSQ